jgi:hypothetical protein
MLRRIKRKDSIFLEAGTKRMHFRVPAIHGFASAEVLA